MRYLYIIAGFLCIVAGINHAVMGGISTLNPLMASSLAMEIRVAILALWHGLTGLFILSTIAFFWAFWAKKAVASAVGILLGTFYILMAMLFAVLSFLWFEDVMVYAQWTLLAPIGLFAIIASL